MIIAVDGPAASGKGTVGKRLAAHYGLRHLDTGLLYRAVAHALLAAGESLENRGEAEAAAAALDLGRLDPQVLKGQQVGEAASVVSAYPEVRAALVRLQRSFAAEPPGAVIDGRDIGTVICPDADVKIFLTADPAVRAQRRSAEFAARGEPVPFETVLADIVARDERDRSRPVAPLRQADDAVLLDTTHLDIDAAVRAAIAIVEAARAGRSGA